MNKITLSFFPLVAGAALLITAMPCLAQKGSFDPNKGVRDAGMVTPTPVDKIIRIQMLLGKKVNWKQVAKAYNSYMDVDDYSNKKVILPVLMGMRMSDGALSIMARDVEVLNGAAGDIETMASKLGVGEGQLLRAKKVRSYANKNKWNRVFLELGFLQKDVMDTMAKEGNSDRRAILIAAGWLQGANMVTSVIKDHYTAETSSLLREPLLVKQMIKDLGKLKEDKRKDVVVIKMLAALKDLSKRIDVGINKPIPEADVKKIYEITSDFSKFVVDENKR